MPIRKINKIGLKTELTNPMYNRLVDKINELIDVIELKVTTESKVGRKLLSDNKKDVVPSTVSTKKVNKK